MLKEGPEYYVVFITLQKTQILKVAKRVDLKSFHHKKKSFNLYMVMDMN